MRFGLSLLLAGVAATAVGCASFPSASSNLGREAVVPQQAGDSYYEEASAAISARIEERGIKPAKNVILFIGDGMGISTITAARIYAGQTRGVDGESYKLTMETLPYAALSRTYSHDYQVADSASTATAMVAGAKVRSRTLGILQDATLGDCESMDGNRTDTLFDLAERAGLSTGIVSTARITHATPAATYAESPHRDWEADSDMDGKSSPTCADIASQLVNWAEGDGFEVAMGGGRAMFTTDTTADAETPDKMGDRTDNIDLTKEWAAKSDAHIVISGQADFDTTDFDTDVKVLGLFDRSHMKFELDRAEGVGNEPSLEELTRAAITRLSRDEDGYVLMVEAGRIDHAHHGVNAARALGDTDIFDQAIATALEMTDNEDTLIIVTADHSHTMTIAGYPTRGNPILGKVDTGTGGDLIAKDGKPYTTLSYANGQTACREVAGINDCARLDLSHTDTTDKNFLQQSLAFASAETHAGEDVAIFATGPGSNLISGTMDQNEIFHVMGRASELVAEKD